MKLVSLASMALIVTLTAWSLFDDEDSDSSLLSSESESETSDWDFSETKETPFEKDVRPAYYTVSPKIVDPGENIIEDPFARVSEDWFGNSFQSDMVTTKEAPETTTAGSVYTLAETKIETTPEVGSELKPSPTTPRTTTTTTTTTTSTTSEKLITTTTSAQSSTTTLAKTTTSVSSTQKKIIVEVVEKSSDVTDESDENALPKETKTEKLTADSDDSSSASFARCTALTMLLLALIN